MSEQILANGRNEEIFRQFLVCTHNFFDSLSLSLRLDIRSKPEK